MQTCEAPGCNRNKHSKKYCETHYQKVRRTGTLDQIRYTEAWKEKQRQSHLSKLGKMNPEKGLHSKGAYAVNVVNDVRYKARKRGKAWELNNEEAFSIITGECKYCGFKPDWPKQRIGIDRLDNNKGYTIENSVPCCFTCNSAKGTKSLEEFKDWLKRLINHFGYSLNKEATFAQGCGRKEINSTQ